MAKSLVCWNCGGSLDDIPRPISRHANCSACFEVLHCCRMCRHYEPDKRPYCDHERAEPPVEKETANFCDYFKPVNRYSKREASRGNRAKSDLEALFGDDLEGSQQAEGSSPADGSQQAEGSNLTNPSNERDSLSKLNDLFDD